MSCLIPLIAGACLFDPSQLQVAMDLSTQIGRGDTTYIWYNEAWHDYTRKTMGRIEVSAGGHLTREVEIVYGLRHESLPSTSQDKGDNRAFVGFVWRPFAR